MPGGSYVLARLLSSRDLPVSLPIRGDERRGFDRVLLSLGRVTASSHRPASVRHRTDEARWENVTDGRKRLAGGAIRGAPVSPARGGLPDARFGERGRRRRPGNLVP